MAYCPSCANEVLVTDARCGTCGADFTAGNGWKPLDARPESEPEGRPLRWWQKVLWFLGFWIITVQFWKFLGANALTQLLFAIIFGVLGVVWMNSRAIKQSKLRATGEK